MFKTVRYFATSGKNSLRRRIQYPTFWTNCEQVLRINRSLVTDSTTGRKIRLLPEFPQVIKLELSQKLVRIDNLCVSHMRESLNLIKESVQRQDNLAEDEFESQEDIFTDGTAAFVLQEPPTDLIQALLIIQPCPYSRSIVPRLALFSTITSLEFSSIPVWRDLARLAQSVSDRLSVGYVACVSGVFVVCLDRLRALIMEGFHTAACIPSAGRLAGSRQYSSSYVMYKKFNMQEISEMPFDIASYANDLCSTFDDDPKLWKCKLKFPNLPVTEPLPDGTNYSFRELRPHEISRYYAAFKSAAAEDTGFSLEEIPSLKFFWWTFSKYYNCVVEEMATSRWMAITCSTSSPFSRSKRAAICDGSIIVLPEFRSLGLAKAMLENLSVIYGLVGFDGLVSDAPIDHLRSLSASLASMVVIGTLPTAIFGKKRSVNEIVILYRPLAEGIS